MNIRDLLNPVGQDMPHRRSSNNRKYIGKPSDKSERPVGTSRQKLVKDAPVFTKNNTRGPVNFPPHEASNDKIEKEHKKFKIYPAGQIASFPRHIPYSSDKIGFQRKLGRDAFEVFQYTFKLPEGGRDWTVMWDYNIGLVRITPFFKSLKQPKTAAGKVLQQNNGLKDLCYNVTGGALAAQGYWVPYDAAKALAATFCHKIRFALTPLFGEDFPVLCTDPEDPIFGRMMIEMTIVDQHRAEAEARSPKADCSRGASRLKRGSKSITFASPEVDTAFSSKRLKSRLDKSYNNIRDQDTFENSTQENYKPKQGTKSLVGFTAINQDAVMSAHTESGGTPDPEYSETQNFREPIHSGDSPLLRPGTKRRIIVEDSDEDESEIPTRDYPAKQRRFGDIGAEEARAAYGLLEMAIGRRSLPRFLREIEDAQRSNTNKMD